jgi:hypothetical protein
VRAPAPTARVDIEAGARSTAPLPLLEAEYWMKLSKDAPVLRLPWLVIVEENTVLTPTVATIGVISSAIRSGRGVTSH